MLVEVDVLDELGAAALLLGVVLLELELGEALVELELEVAPGAVAAFWSVVLVLEGAAVGFAWLDVWSEAAGLVDV
ncbi:MAG: hypothetical protein DMG61_19400 [Acidobacteria bacterium]|nr:MAG: hypothetical protein DMG61_19400 [Acidobacteriota bacterium]PYY17861.1 MAG: hypothetical protein DMG60_10235 [Acidobacteriota bacterium]